MNKVTGLSMKYFEVCLRFGRPLIHLVKDCISQYHIAFILQRKSNLLKLVNTNIVRFKEHGKSTF